jgi:alpha-1,3-rhamnosyl/mannosyltransferase
MRITIDASPLLLRSAGVKSYLYHWIQALQSTAGRREVAAYPFLDRYGELTHNDSVLSRIGTIPRIAWLLAGNRVPVLRRWGAGRSNIFHVTNQVHGAVPGMALTATIHDMTCWIMPDLHTPANIKADSRFAERILLKADGMIAVSENSRQDAIRILHLKPEKVVAIHSGVPDTYFAATEESAVQVRDALGLSKPFILHVGTIEPRKNLDALIDGYLLLPDSLRGEVDLVLAGPMGWAAGTTAHRIMSGLRGVRYLGYVSEKDLPALTKAATVFAYPSLYEGFGFPPAQAMAAGVPVLTSNSSCLPEITGRGALHVDPRSPAEISRGLERLLTSPSFCAELVREGTAKAAEYRWERCAQRSWEFFEQFV